MVGPAHRVPVHRGVIDHMQQPDGLERLPEAESRPSRDLPEIHRHLLQLPRSLRATGLSGIRLTPAGKAPGVVDHSLNRDPY